MNFIVSDGLKKSKELQMKVRSFFIISLFLLSCSLDAKDKKILEPNPNINTEKIVEVKGIPWGLEFISPEEFIVTLKEGKIFTYNIKTKNLKAVKGGPLSSVHGQGGLLDIMLHPDFKTNFLVFFSYTKKMDDLYTTAIATGELRNNEITKIKDIFVANNPNKNHIHFGSRIVHDGNGHLFFTVGDRGERKLAQSLQADQGKVHRIYLDGSIPKDNPFFNQEKVQKTIWSFGHRNPQGLVYDFKNKILYEQEHGPRGGDEINIVVKGKNYGWPEVTFGREYHGPRISKFTTKKGYQDPIYQFTPSIAPSGLELYTGDKFPDLKGTLLSGALAYTHFNVLHIKDLKNMTETRYFENLKERVRDIKQSPTGDLYFSTDSGKIYRLSF